MENAGNLLPSVRADARQMFDPTGKDVTPFHYTTDDAAGTGPQFIEQAQAWFDSMWRTVSRERP